MWKGSRSREGLCVWAWRDNPPKVAAYATEVDLGIVSAGARPLEEGANGNGLSDPLGQSHQWLC